MAQSPIVALPRLKPDQQPSSEQAALARRDYAVLAHASARVRGRPPAVAEVVAGCHSKIPLPTFEEEVLDAEGQNRLSYHDWQSHIVGIMS